MKEHRYDYVIVGAGTAGCLLANRLSADPDVTVLLLEAGGKDDWIWIKIPVGYLFCINNPRTDWCYKTEPDPGLNGRSIIYARGKVLGGCSSINAMIYMRGQARGLRRVGDADRRQLVALGVGAADLPPERGLLPRRGRGARRGRRVARRAAAAALGHPRRLPRGDGRGGHSEDRRLQPRRQRGLQLLPRQPDEGRAPEHVAGVPEARDEPPQPDGDDRSAGAPADVRRPALHRGRARCVAARPSAWPRASRRSSPPAASDRRRSCSCPASGRAPCCSSTAFRCCTRCPASARTCRTTCSCAWRSR